MKPKLFLVFSLIGISKIYAQTDKSIAIKKMRDSMKLVYLTELAKRQPALRQGSFSVDFVGKGNVESKANGQTIYKGEAKITRIKSNFNVPISTWGKNSLSASFNYVQQHFNFGENTTGGLPLEGTRATKAAVGFSGTFVRADSLFKHPVVYSLSMSAFTDELSSIKRLNYTGAIFFPLKTTQNTVITAGVVVVLDPSSAIPAAPFFGYWHRFSNSKLEFTAELPSNLTLRLPVSAKTWVTFGTAVDQNYTFFNYNEPLYSLDLVQNVLDLKTSLNIERMITKKLVVGLRGGVITTLSSRIFQNGKRQSEYLANNSNSAVPFVNFSISFLPFLKTLK